MKTIFDISADRRSSEPYILLMEAGSRHLAYAYYDKNEQRLDRLVYHQFEEPDLESSISSVLNQLNPELYQQTFVASAFPEAILVPQKYGEHSSSLVDLLYQMPAHKNLQDRIAEWQIIAAYSVPEFLYDALQQRLNRPQFYHTYTTSIKTPEHFGDQQLQLHFRGTDFSVLLKTSGQLQLAQTYSFATPLDVVYYLLKICYEFGLPQSDVVLVLSGFIETDSALYQQLKQYFLHLHFTAPPSLVLPSEEHPHYYFHSLYNLAACVL